ncbi:MAG: 2-C-methyl-D-erythritol 2,4-cyclodiphosphate synthase [Candidatus Omnitrophica bacterium]|nr:2-C-methyl-D-erythritol 2,4-cyclodiphosphate synthase [Candidatus Omnitrophota bacterium]
MDYKVGIGYDIHRLVKKRKLILGGIEIPYKRGLLGHSDGDVLIHAICDALLGAMGKPDIGEHFPDNELQYKDIASSELLIKVKLILDNLGFQILNLDTLIIVQEPKMYSFKKQIQQRLADILELSPELINVKAKTSEGLGEIGRRKAIACWAVVLLKRKER